MGRRRLLTDEQMAPFWAWASDERGIVQHYTLSPADLDLVDKKRVGANRLGFALLLGGMRFPGRILDVGETPPAEVLAFVAEQVAVPASELAAYSNHTTNRREHVAELFLGCRASDKDATRELSAVAVSLAHGMPRLERLVAAVIEEASESLRDGSGHPKTWPAPRYSLPLARSTMSWARHWSSTVECRDATGIRMIGMPRTRCGMSFPCYIRNRTHNYINGLRGALRCQH